MATKLAGRSVTRLIRDRINNQQGWLDPLADRLQHELSKTLEWGGPSAQRVKDALNGVWLGHSLHPALTDLPIGAWSTSLALDLVGQKRGADTALALGVLAAVPTAMAGLADWHDQAGPPRRTGLVHALLNGAALVCYLGSIVARRAERRALGIGLSTTGLTLTSGSAYLGGKLVYSHGVGVDRNAWNPEVDDYQFALASADLAEGRLTAGAIEIEGQKLPLVLLRKSPQILALGAVCSHVGGPLAEGKLIGDACVACPWHGSTFDLRTGAVVHGPAACPQPAYEARELNGRVEVRLKR